MQVFDLGKKLGFCKCICLYRKKCVSLQRKMKMLNRQYILWLSLLCLIACGRPNAEQYYEQGRAQRAQGEAVEAMKSFIAATRVRSSEYVYKGRSYSNIANMCRMGERHDLAYVFYEQSAEQFIAAKDSLLFAYALNNMAWEQAVQSNKQEAERLIDSAVVVYADSAIVNKVIETRAAACLYAEEYDSVLYYTQKVPMKSNDSAYFAILRAQTFTLLNQCDSALLYARQIVTQTDNPRYLDDAYYVLIHCDSCADVDEVRDLAATRTDIQRSLERNNPEWTQAMLLAEESLGSPKSPMKSVVFALLAIVFLLMVRMTYSLVSRKRKQRTTEEELERQCVLLCHSTDLKNELRWDDYTQFCAVCNTRLFGIAEKLQMRGLNERDVRLSVLFMIGLSYAEIAEILYRAESGIGKDKYSIAKHLGVSIKELQNTLREMACEKENA